MLLADQYLVSAGLVNSLDSFCSSRRTDAAAGLLSLKMAPTYFKRPDLFVNFVKFVGLMENLAKDFTDEKFGLIFGLDLKLKNLGAFGLGFANAPSFGHALGFYVRYISLVADHAICRVHTGVVLASIEWDDPSIIVKKSQFVDLIATLIIRQLRLFTKPSWFPTNVELTGNIPKDLDFYQRQLCPNISFNADINRIIFPKDCLSIKNQGADDRLYKIMEWRCEDSLARKNSSAPFIIKVRKEILKCLGSGNTSPSIIATGLGISEQNLRNQLFVSGVDFETVVEATRRELSDYFEENSQLTFVEIGTRLGTPIPANT
jgi:hypothetical protein